MMKMMMTIFGWHFWHPGSMTLLTCPCLHAVSLGSNSWRPCIKGELCAVVNSLDRRHPTREEATVGTPSRWHCLYFVAQCNLWSLDHCTCTISCWYSEWNIVLLTGDFLLRFCHFPLQHKVHPQCIKTHPKCIKNASKMHHIRHTLPPRRPQDAPMTPQGQFCFGFWS